jgi:hypothetical protein
MRGCFEGNVAEERVDGGQTKVPRPRRHMARFLQFVEEVAHQLGIDILEHKGTSNNALI